MYKIATATFRNDNLAFDEKLSFTEGQKLNSLDRTVFTISKFNNSVIIY